MHVINNPDTVVEWDWIGHHKAHTLLGVLLLSLAECIKLDIGFNGIFHFLIILKSKSDDFGLSGLAANDPPPIKMLNLLLANKICWNLIKICNFIEISTCYIMYLWNQNRYIYYIIVYELNIVKKDGKIPIHNLILLFLKFSHFRKSIKPIGYSHSKILINKFTNWNIPKCISSSFFFIIKLLFFSILNSIELLWLPKTEYNNDGHSSDKNLFAKFLHR